MPKPLNNIVFRIITIALIHTFILGWMVWDRVSLLRNGQEIRLSVEPVDPRDLLRGDYIILRFGISQIDTRQVDMDRDFHRGELIFVGLKKLKDGTWKAISINHQKPQVKSDIVFIKGKVKYVSKSKRLTTGLNKKHSSVSIKYGMEKYFIPQGDGPKLEALRNEKVLNILAAVSDSGEAGIKALLVRGKQVYEEPFF